MHRFLRRHQSSLLYRAAALALGGWYAVLVIGVPLPSLGPVASERFPCELCRCGCATAEQCWRSCCCHSLAERLAWAAAEGIQPPEYALAEARRQGLSTESWLVSTEPAPTSPCCTAKPSLQLAGAPLLPAECRLETPTAACCSRMVSAHVADGPPATGFPQPPCEDSRRDSGDNDSGDNGTIGWRAFACGGQSLQWLAAVPAVVVHAEELLAHSVPPRWMSPAIAPSFLGASPSPPTPPPRPV